ncbi:MAG: peptidoglycan DD-metalloendopeptidase family protein [Bacillota bacterium]|jgi:peptidoglycan hydrolase CwlO-like protein|nr:peptidoglycan DD-metalloendopeptidase family protein [Bacillota bacterium]NLL26529.1 peptidoglycan DD-metalloendopeptidase family protein [Erysipelotrichia bacterium]
MKILKKFLKLLLVTLCILISFSTFQSERNVLADDEDFENNYEYYCDLCSTQTQLSDEQKQTCIRFRKYEQQKQDELKDLINETAANLKNLKANILSEGKRIAQFNDKIASLEKEIKAIQNTIIVLEENIEELNIQIEERKIKIENLNNQIKERMAASQSNVRTSSYIRFIMGADSFIDLLRRISAIAEISDYDMFKIEEMQKEKDLLQIDVDNLEIQKNNLFIQQTSLETQKNGLEKLKAAALELMEEFQRKEAEFQQQMDALEKDYSELEKRIDEIDAAINALYPSNGFAPFFKNTSFWISAGCYYYQSGGFHAAIDAAVRIGVNIYPVGNGVVVDARGGCAYNGGYYGNTCNWGRGNYVFILVLINDEYYFIQYDHLKDIYVKVGDIVYQGRTVMGTTGNSGSSSGPHLHFAITYLGTTSTTTVKKILNDFKRYNNTFGLSYHIKNSCANRGWAAPCFVNPTDIYGYRYGKYYWVGS